jgi:DNA-binding FadR family transcriptional regulator
VALAGEPTRELVVRIARGDLPPGVPLVGVDAAALDELARRGLCDGTGVVHEPEHWNVLDPDVARAVVAHAREAAAADLIGETLDALRLLQCSAARTAARRVTPTSRSRLLHALACLQAQVSEEGMVQEGYVAARAAVHRAITLAAASAALTRATTPLLVAFEAFGFAGGDARESAIADPLELEWVIDAIVVADGRHAASTMGAHVRRLNRRLGGTAQ